MDNAISIKKSFRESSHVKTYAFVKQCMQEVRTLDQKQTSTELKEKSGMLAKLRWFLFDKPLRNYILALTFFALILLIGALITKIINNFYLNILYFLFSLSLYLVMTVSLHFITPKSKMGYDERWMLTVKIALDKLSKERVQYSTIKNLEYFKGRIKESINHYSREGKFFGYILKFLGGGVFIGCLPDPKFQKAFLSFPNIIRIWNINPFGAICLVVILFFGPFYYFRYGLPKIWMEQVLSQIELCPSESEFVQKQNLVDVLSGFIGCGEADSDLSTNYKFKYANSLEDKYGQS